MSKSVHSVSSVSSISHSAASAALSEILSYSDIRDFLLIRLVNYAHNLEKMGDVPYVQKEDLAVVFYYSPVVCGEAAADPKLITAADLSAWDIDLYTLYRDALVSSMNLAPAALAPMQDLIGLSEEEAADSFPMYVLSCRKAQYGAAAALYPQVLANIAEGFRDNLYLIPSSVHEWIILRASMICDPAPIGTMIREINQTEVLPGEVLSDSLYYYDAKKDKLSRVVSSGKSI